MEGQIKVLRASNKTLQKKLEAAAAMEKNMNVGDMLYLTNGRLLECLLAVTEA